MVRITSDVSETDRSKDREDARSQQAEKEKDGLRSLKAHEKIS